MESAQLTTVLVVEDEAIIASDIQEILSRLGYSVPRTAATGAAAIRAATELRPNLILMDIRLRGEMDGVEAASAIREAIDVPVIFLTSYSDDDTLERAKRATPSGYLLKPFTDRSLRTAVEVALHKHGLESNLAEREDWFSMTLEAIADGVIATDTGGKITLMNPAAEKLTGWHFKDARGKILDEVFRIVEADGSACPTPIGEALRCGAKLTARVGALLASRSAGNIEIDHNGAPIIGRRGNLLGAVLVFRNVTERRDLEHRVVRSERLASLGTMAAGMVHEINNPMTYITANDTFAAERIAALLAELSNDDPSAPHVERLSKKWVAELGEARDALSESFEGAKRVRDIIKSVGRFTRIDRPGLTHLSLACAIDQAAKMVASQFPPRTEIIRDFRPAPMVAADETQLVEVFMNLLVNAAHALASNEGRPPRITVSTYADGTSLAMAEVRDNGRGIPEGIVSRIFEPFFTTKAVGAGSGLGLHLSHVIIEGFGGQISVASEESVGTVFRIALPAVS